MILIILLDFVLRVIFWSGNRNARMSSKGGICHTCNIRISYGYRSYRKHKKWTRFWKIEIKLKNIVVSQYFTWSDGGFIVCTIRNNLIYSKLYKVYYKIYYTNIIFSFINLHLKESIWISKRQENTCM